MYRKAVIRELLTERFRVVAPSYGYDAVPVLAHALAAHHLRLQQLRTLLAGAALIAFLMVAGVLDTLGAALLFGWLAWATMFLRRIAVLRTLAAHLAPPAAGAAFDGRYPGPNGSHRNSSARSPTSRTPRRCATAGTSPSSAPVCCGAAGPTPSC